ncbi:MAG: hypothetical protein U9Q77_00735, partial [Candidatus Marinimicrobia bacterium]|nr:hypothetical protein [Candidatus Neomarinimicrobiota bacterium]
MKSKMTNFVVLICLLSMGGMVFGQIAPIDFEAGGYGADWTWTVFENGTNPPVAIIANPDATGSNTSATVAEFTALDAGMDWAGCENLDIGEFTFDATNSTVTIAVYKTVLSDFRLKFEGASAPVEINVANTVTSAWEELTYDFSGQIGNTYNKLVIFPDFAPRDQDNIIYFDNITFSEQIISEDPVPTVAAPTPTIPEAEVISIYSDAYTDIAGTDFYPGWGQATVVTEVQIDGNNTLLYTGLNYQGIVLGSPQDVSTMGYLHVDFWSTNSTALSLFLISQTTGERSFAFTITNDEWVSVDIPLTAFTDQGMTIADIHQLKYDGNGDIYLDNMFFHGDAPAEDPVPTVAAPTPTVPEAEVVSIYSDAYTDVAGTDFNPGWGQATVFSEVQVDGNNTLLYAGLNYQGTVFAGPVDVSTFGYFHVDFWSTNSTALGLSLISQTTGERLYNFTVTNNEWVSVDVPLSHFADLGLNLADIHQLKFEGNGDVYLDNYFFHGDAPEEDLVPTVAAPAPTVPEVDVVSVYSDAYTDIAGTNFNPGWGQTTVITEVQIDGNNTLLYSGLDYQGIELGSPQDVSAMGYLHVDFWSANSTALEVSLISQTTGERTYACTVINDEWVSVDIPLTAYTDQGMTLGDVFQLKYVGNGDVYLDNMYFYAEEEVVTGPNAPIDFEAEGFGADWGWSTFENGANDPPAIIANPHAEGINTSATVAEFTALVAGQPWAGFESTHGADIGTFNLDATNSTIKIMVYKTVISDVGIKLAKPDGWAMPEIKVANTLINEWEELTFDFSTHHQEGYDQIVVFPDFNLDGRTQDNLVYLD